MAGGETRSGDSTLLLLLSLQLLLLAFFILLNGISNRGAPVGHGRDVLAAVRDGYAFAADPFAPVGNELPWEEVGELKRQKLTEVQGLLTNKIKLLTVPLEVKGERLVMEFPLAAMLTPSGALVNAGLVDNILSASGNVADVHWRVQGKLAADARLGQGVAALAERVGRVEMAEGPEAVVVTFVPTEKNGEAGVSLQNLGLRGGANRVQGEGFERGR